MKRVIVLIAVMISVALTVSGQGDIKVPLSNPGEPGVLEVGVLYGSIIVEAHAGSDVIVSATENESKRRRKSKSKNGMKRVGGSSMDYEIEEYNNLVTIGSHSNSRMNYVIKVPANFSLKLSALNDGDIIVTGVSGDIEVSNTNGGIELNDVSGTVTADALNDDIKVTFNKIEPSSTMVFSNLNGDIDLALPDEASVSLKMKTDMGDVYTDFELEPFSSEPTLHKEETKRNGYRVQVEKWINGNLNGGGATIRCKTFNGDILIRKAE